MFVISFHGGKSGLNNLHAFTDDGKPATPPKLLITGGKAPTLSELRAFRFGDGGVYVVNGQKKASQLLFYAAGKNGQFTFSREIASASTCNGIRHPFDFTFDDQGRIFLSSQDTNVVTGLTPAGQPLPLAGFLQKLPGSSAFLSGTIVASSVGKLPLTTASPPDVPVPQGLAVEITKSKVAHSVRGVVWTGGCLLVADEPWNAVKVYDSSGLLICLIASTALNSPVHLLLQGGILYISGSDSIFTVTTSSLPSSLKSGRAIPTVAPTAWITGLDAPSGMCFDGNGSFYVALRKKKQIAKFDSSGKSQGSFIKALGDNPEFIAWQPDSDK